MTIASIEPGKITSAAKATVAAIPFLQDLLEAVPDRKLTATSLK